MKPAGTYLASILLASMFATGAAHAQSFAADVYPLLQKAGCPGCHNHDGVASPTRLKFPEGDASPAAIEAFGHSLAPLINREKPAASLLLLKPTRRVPHAGGKRFEPGGPEEMQVQKWIEQVASKPPVEVAARPREEPKPAGAVLRRLTNSQYNSTVRDLLGDDSRIANGFPPEDFVNGFRNQYQSQSTSPLLAESYAMAAEKLAKRALSRADINGIVPCQPATPNDAECRSNFIRSFGRKAFRRPLTVAEFGRYAALFTAAANDSGDFHQSAQMVVEAMLQSPNFLLRVEGGQVPEWQAYETASRLSYFLWNSMPDEQLFRSAEKGELNTPEGLEREARRLLRDPRAQEAMNEFLGEWLRLDRLQTAVKDRRTFPTFTLELAASMAEETRRLFSNLVWGNGNFMEFYSADYAYVSSDLASLYRIKPPAQEYAKVSLAATERSGVLGQATFLALTSKPAETSPTARGLFVREQFLCQEVPQPPPGVSTNLPALTKAKPQTTRERLDVHLNSESCASCHALIDPIGFGFEKFDAIGQRREKQKIVFRAARGEKDEGPTSVELDLDTSGQVAGLKDSAFSSPLELGKILAASTQCQECVVKQLFRYAAGRHENSADRVVIGRAYKDFRDSGFRFQELLVSLSRWMVFPPSGGTDGISSH
jgi:hypothetical protein